MGFSRHQRYTTFNISYILRKHKKVSKSSFRRTLTWSEFELSSLFSESVVAVNAAVAAVLAATAFAAAAAAFLLSGIFPVPKQFEVHTF